MIGTYIFIVLSIAIMFFTGYKAFSTGNLEKNSGSFTKYVLIIMSIASMMAIIYSLFTFGQASFNSDSAIPIRSYRIIAETKKLFPTSWLDANGEYYIFHSNSIGILMVLLFKNQSLGRVVASFICIFIATVGTMFLSKKLFDNNSWAVSLPLIFLFMQGIEALDVLVYQAAYTALVVSATFCSAATYLILVEEESKTRKSIVIKALLCSSIFFMTLSGKRYFAEFIVPVVIAIVCFVYFDSQYFEGIEKKKLILKMATIFGYLLIPAALGFGTYKWLASWHQLTETAHTQLIFIESLDALREYVYYTFINVFKLFGFKANITFQSIYGVHNVLSIVIAFLICFIIPIKQFMEIKNENAPTKYFLYFGYIHNFIMIIISCLFVGKANERYMISTVIIFILISSRYVYDRLLSKGGKIGNAWAFLWLVAVLIECISLLSYSKGWKEVYDSNKELATHIAESGYAKGYGTYLNVMNMEIYSDKALQLGCVTVDGASLTLGGGSNYDARVLLGTEQPTFLLLRDYEAEQATELMNQLSEPVKTEDVKILGYDDNGEIVEKYATVYYFNYDIANSL